MEGKIKKSHIFVIILACIDMNEGVNENQKFYVITDVEMQTAMSVFNRSSKLQCGRQCSQRSGCLSFGFTSSTEMCRLFDSDPLIAASDSTSAIGSVLYARDCGKGWLKFRDSCYKFSTTSKSWVNSKTYCESVGASLAKVRYEAEHQFIRQTAAETNQDLFWIGGRYNISTGNYRWSDGSAISFHGWRPNIPPNVEGCVDYLEKFNWLWNQHWDCYNTYGPFICKKSNFEDS